jgi:hypothetical protein
MVNESSNIVRILGLIGVGGWILVLACAVASPATPDPATGHVIPFNNHGRILYVTPLVHYLVFWYVPVLIAFGAAVKFAAGRKRRDHL